MDLGAQPLREQALADTVDFDIDLDCIVDSGYIVGLDCIVDWDHTVGWDCIAAEACSGHKAVVGKAVENKAVVDTVEDIVVGIECTEVEQCSSALA